MDRKIDFALALGIIALGVFLIIEAQAIGRSPVPDPIGPRGIPTGLGVAFVVSGAALALRRAVRWRIEGPIVEPEGAEDDQGVPPGSARRGLGIWIASVVYVVALPFLGFLVATPLLIAAMLRLFEFQRPPVLGRIPGLLAYPLAFTAAAYVTFAVILGVRLPLGFVRDIYLSLIGVQ